MTDNIVSTISRLLTPELIGKLAAAAGLDRAMAPKATAAALPAILSGLADVAARPGGARQLASTVAEQPSDLIGSIANSLGGAQQMVEKGSSMLSSLLGGSMTGILAAGVAKFLGIGEAPTRALIGLLTPIIMGILGREQRTQGLDSNGLARLLTSQKDEIAAAMPAGLGRLLESSGFSGASSTPVSPDRPAYEAAQASLDPQRSASLRTAGTEGSRGLSWAYWVLPLLVLAGLIWFLLPQQERTVESAPPAQTTSLPTQPATDAPGKLTYLTFAREDWTSIGSAPNEYTNQDVYNAAGENLGTIRDVLMGPDGKAAAAIINVGRFLGIGDKEIAVPFSALRLERQGDNRRIVIDAVKEGVQAAPTFTRRTGVKQ